MDKFKNIFRLLPDEYKNKSNYFVIFLLIATLLETVGIGIIFPLLEIVVSGEVSNNIFSESIKNIFSENNQFSTKIQ